MSERREEYVTDVPYVRGFEEDLSPARLRLVAGLNGFAPPPAEEFDYCELGCAHGDTIAALAASYPRARFVGVDLNAEHVAAARALAEGGGLANLRVLQKDFEDLHSEDLPAFDYVVAHGVLSWVGPSKRKAVLELASRRLKPGGLLHVSYNALPGWAAVEPLRQLLLARADLAQGTSAERARHGVELARRMNDLGAEYFRGNPAARAMLAHMERLGLAYIVHEYMHAHWVPMYFAQLAAEMAAHDLFFAGQMPLYLNYRDLAIPAPLAPLFESVGDRVTFESLKDFAVNESFRRDVYVKGRVARSDAATRQYVDTTHFGAIGESELAQREKRLPHHTLRFAGPIFDVLIPALLQGAATVPALAARPELLGFGLPRTRDAIARLVSTELVTPTLGETRAAASHEDRRLTVPSPYNRWVLHHGASGDGPVVLASPVLGNGVELSAVEAVAMVILADVEPVGRVAAIADLCRRESFRLETGGKLVGDPEERRAVLLDETEKFRLHRVPKLIELGIAAGTPG